MALQCRMVCADWQAAWCRKEPPVCIEDGSQIWIYGPLQQQKLDYSPFERFQLGDAGLTNNYGLLGYDIIAHRGYPVYESSDPTVNPDQQNASQFFTIFNNIQLEMRLSASHKSQAARSMALTFFEAANGWYNFKDYNPFRLRRSAGVGMRFFLPMFGLLGFDYGIGFDRITSGQSGLKDASRFTFMLGFEPE